MIQPDPKVTPILAELWKRPVREPDARLQIFRAIDRIKDGEADAVPALDRAAGRLYEAVELSIEMSRHQEEPYVMAGLDELGIDPEDAELVTTRGLVAQVIENDPFTGEWFDYPIVEVVFECALRPRVHAGVV